MRVTLLSLLLACDDQKPTDDSGAHSGETGESAPLPVDDDGDGHASVETGGDDCDDSNPEIFPGVEEICDEVDQDCDGAVDEDAVDASAWYADADADGYGDLDAPLLACAQPTGSSADATDCDDANAAVWPGAEELCGDGLDNGCDGFGSECRLEGERALADALGFTGDAAGDTLGSALAGLGDLDGDGAADLALGAPGADGGGARSGAARVLRGPFDTAGASASFTLVGEGDGDEAGMALLGADLDGDGQAELVVGGPGGEGGAGVVWVSSALADGSLAESDARLVGPSSVDEVGAHLARGGAPDGAGAVTLLVGAPSAGGGVGVVFLTVEPPSGTVQLGEAATRWEGVTIGDGAGPVGGGGDLDGDGVADAAVGAPGEDAGGLGAGALYVLLDAAAGGVLSDADAIWSGEAAGDAAGSAVALVGDTNADGYDDLLVGGPNHDEGGDYAGVAWLLLGPAAAGGGLLDADARLVGGAAGDSAGTAVAGPGDVDGDGCAELMVGSPWADGDVSNAGRADLLYGPVSGTRSLAEAELGLGGEASLNRAGSAVAGAGDADGDGALDLLVGAPYLRATGSDAGKAYLIFGVGY